MPPVYKSTFLSAVVITLFSSNLSAQVLGVLPDDEYGHDFQPASGDGSGTVIEQHDDGAGLPLEPERTVSLQASEATWLSLDVSSDDETIIFEFLGDIFTIPANGGEAVAVTEGMGFDSQPAYSPDSELIAFVSDRSGSENLWIANADGSAAKALTSDSEAQFTSPAWTPDGLYVIVSRSSWGLRTNELWMYHKDGGNGVRLTTAKAAANTPTSQRLNALGPQVSADGRYVYYASRRGGFSYNLSIPAWTIARMDLETGDTDTVITAQGSAMRPILSPDGRYMVYATRFDAETGLRLRDLETGEDDWLIFPVTRDDQESRFTRDLYPAATFTSDSSSLLTTFDGKIQSVSVPDGIATEIPFSVTMEHPIGPDLDFEQSIETGDIQVRIAQTPAVSPDGEEIVFSALGELYVHAIEDNETRLLDEAGSAAFHPSWSPDGRDIVYVSWEPEGGHIWKIRANGSGNPDQLTENLAYYTDPVFTPDGEQVVALRASNASYVSREVDFGPVPTSDLIRLPEDGGEVTVITHAVGMIAPHFAANSDRVYLTTAGGLISLRMDGMDRRTHLQVKGKGAYSSEEAVAADEMRIAPDGNWALAQVSNQLYLIAVPRTGPSGAEVNVSSPSVPATRLSDLAPDYFGWSEEGQEFFWAVGTSVYRQTFDSISFGDEEDGDNDGADSESENAEDEGTVPVLREDSEDVETIAINLSVERDVPEGSILLRGAKVITMNGDQVIENGEVLITGNKVAGVGNNGSLQLPEDTEIIDINGRVVMPGFVDSHAHWFEIRRGIIEENNWAFLANFAYGVTSGLDVQTATNDMFAYQDMIDSGRMIGPRAFSTGPGVFSDNGFNSYDEAYGVLKRYQEHYRTRNIKAYISGDRKQRHWLVQASQELGMMPTTEGALDLKLNLTHAIDGFWGTEHALPIVPLYEDVVELFAQTGIAYTPTLLVAYGGPWAENYFYSRSNPHDDPKLSRFTPHHALDARTRRRPGWFMDEEHVFTRLAEGAAQVLRAGGKVGVGSHGQLQGLGYHWELWALASGGLTNMEALRVATLGGAEIIGYENEIGSLEVGKYADIVVLSADPLEDIENSNSVSMVMRNGRLYDANTLEEIAPGNRPAPELWFSDLPPTRR